MAEYIEREAAINEFANRSQFYDAEWGNKRFTPDDVETIICAIPAADVVSRDRYDRLLAENDELRKERPVHHGNWEKRMEHRKGDGYEAYTPVWRCSACGKDYDPATALIVNYCFNCGARMDGDGE